jgi:Nucleoside diphosphate kinase
MPKQFLLFATVLLTLITISEAIEFTHILTKPRRMEQTFIAIKPDGVMRGLVGEIIARFEKRGFVARRERG